MRMTNPCSSIRWAFNVTDWKPTKEQIILAFQCIQSEERERCLKFVYIDDCKSSLIGRLLMRKAANEVLKIPYDKIAFERTQFGKPSLSQEITNFNFNISHNGDFCVLAADKNYNIGIDVMKIELKGKRTIPEYFSLMRKQFSSLEWDFLSLPGTEKEKLERFYRLWCLKESYLKATGTGIMYHLHNLSFACHSPHLKKNFITDTELFINGKQESEWYFQETLLDDNHCVAVALGPISKETSAKTKIQVINFKFLTFEELIENALPFERIEANLWDKFKEKDIKM